MNTYLLPFNSKIEDVLNIVGGVVYIYIEAPHSDQYFPN